MPVKINVRSHISLHTWSRRTKFFQNPVGRETTLVTGNHQDDNKNTYEANILCSLTFKVFQKHTFFSHKTYATTIAETSRRRYGSSPKRRRRTVLDRFLFISHWFHGKQKMIICFSFGTVH